MRFLTRSQAARFILADPDGYVRSLSTADLSARNQSDKDAYKQMSASAMRSPSRMQMQRMRRLAHRAARALPYVISQRLPMVYVALFNGPYENQLPHTRQNIIFMPAHGLVAPDERVITLFAHELVHIFQRYNRLLTLAILSENGFDAVRRVMPADNIRANPDTDDFLYTNAVPERYLSTRPSNISEVVSGARHPFEVMAYNLQNMVAVAGRPVEFGASW